MPRNGVRNDKKDAAAFPTKQLAVLAACRICEPIAFMSIFPYVYYMIDSFHITSNDQQIALYAGLVTSAFAFAEFATGTLWGRLSDRLGRKPILLMGMAGTGLSILMFGFAPNLATALIARALGGLLNGNQGVLLTTVAELTKVEAHQGLAYSVMPAVWCMGSIIGSIVGGVLADPVRNYPTKFSTGTCWETFPYLLPNLVCAAAVVLSLIVGILFLEETHEDLKERRDYGLEIGDWIINRFRAASRPETSNIRRAFEAETLMLMHEDESPPDYRSTAPSPELSPSRAEPAGVPPPAYHSIEDEQDCNVRMTNNVAGPSNSRRNASYLHAFTNQVLLNILGYGILAYHVISADQLLPVLLSMPELDEQVILPFKFSSGLALPTKTIGGILSLQGGIQLVATIAVFPFVNRKLGTLATFRLTALSYPLLYLLVPYITLVPTAARYPCVALLLVWKVTAQAFAFPSIQIMLANAAPSKKTLGTLYGINASMASLCRGIGPTTSGWLQSAGLSVGALGLPWWFSACVATFGAVLSLFMVNEQKRLVHSEKVAPDDLEDEEAGIATSTYAGNDITTALVATDPSRGSSDLLRTAPSSPIALRTNFEDRFGRRGSRA